MCKHEATEATAPSVCPFSRVQAVQSQFFSSPSQHPITNVQVNSALNLNHSFAYLVSSDPFTAWFRWKSIQTYTQTYSYVQTHQHRQPALCTSLVIQCIPWSLIPFHDFISLCDCVAPMCFWQLYDGLEGPHSLSGSVNWVFSAVSSPPAW